MNFNSSENDFDGEWEDRGDVAWNEWDWRQYLRKADRETLRFISLYESLKNEPNHLDEVARRMGWDREDWAPAQEDDDERGVEPPDLSAIGESPPSQIPDAAFDLDDFDPYTMHRHPVYIVSYGLYQTIRRGWEAFMDAHAESLTPAFTWRFGESLRRGENQALQAVQALDLGDYGLAVCHLKAAHAAVNQSLGLLQTLTSKRSAILRLFLQEMNRRLFDLREIWLRVLADCREENRRRDEES
ncbi:MAG: hypothetical protein ACFE0O_13490 [Opitutales bacterium]